MKKKAGFKGSGLEKGPLTCRIDLDLNEYRIDWIFFSPALVPAWPPIIKIMHSGRASPRRNRGFCRPLLTKSPWSPILCVLQFLLGGAYLSDSAGVELPLCLYELINCDSSGVGLLRSRDKVADKLKQDRPCSLIEWITRRTDIFSACSYHAEEPWSPAAMRIGRFSLLLIWMNTVLFGYFFPPLSPTGEPWLLAAMRDGVLRPALILNEYRVVWIFLPAPAPAGEPWSLAAMRDRSFRLGLDQKSEALNRLLYPGYSCPTPLESFYLFLVWVNELRLRWSRGRKLEISELRDFHASVRHSVLSIIWISRVISKKKGHTALAACPFKSGRKLKNKFSNLNLI